MPGGDKKTFAISARTKIFARSPCGFFFRPPIMLFKKKTFSLHRQRKLCKSSALAARFRETHTRRQLIDILHRFAKCLHVGGLMTQLQRFVTTRFAGFSRRASSLANFMFFRLFLSVKNSFSSQEFLARRAHRPTIMNLQEFLQISSVTPVGRTRFTFKTSTTIAQNFLIFFSFSYGRYATARLTSFRWCSVG